MIGIGNMDSTTPMLYTEGNSLVRRSNTNNQMELLVDYAEANPNLALGRLRSKEARQLSARLWEDIASRLNTDTFGPTSSSKEWCKVWNDLKCRVRAKLMNNNQQLNGTGGGPLTILRLNALEERVANLIGRDCGPIPNVAQNPFILARYTHNIVHPRVEVENLEEESNESHNASIISLHLPPSTPARPEQICSPVLPPSASAAAQDDRLVSTAANQRVASTTAYEPMASTSGTQRVASTTAYEPMASTSGTQRVASTTAYEPMASTSGTQRVASTAAYQPIAPTSAYEPVASRPPRSSPAALSPAEPAALPALHGTTPRRRRRPQQRRSPRAPTMQANPPAALSALEESRAAVIRIEELRARTDSVIAESMLRNAEAAKAQAEAAKTNAEAALLTAQALKSLADGVAQAINAVVHRET